MLTEQEKDTIANTYCPLLVLYPEIEPNSHREDHYHRGHRKSGLPPFDQDYHPRGIELVLDKTFMRIPGKTKPSRSDILDVMSNNEVGKIDIVQDAGPGDVNKFWEEYASICEQEKEEKYPRKAYARVLQGSGLYAEYVIAQYWLAFFFDDWANTHEMDWEMASVVVKRTNHEERPIGCAYCAHMGAFRLPWSQVERVDSDRNLAKEGSHPVVYVANGSHACYFHYHSMHVAFDSFLGPSLSRRIKKYMPWIAKTFIDYVPTFNEGDKHFPKIEVVPEPCTQEHNVGETGEHWHNEWRWLNFEGRWGTKGRFWLRPKQWFTLPWEEDGPKGPTQKGLLWEDPFDWIDHECHDAGSWILSE